MFFVATGIDGDTLSAAMAQEGDLSPLSYCGGYRVRSWTTKIFLHKLGSSEDASSTVMATGVN